MKAVGGGYQVEPTTPRATTGKRSGADTKSSPQLQEQRQQQRLRLVRRNTDASEGRPGTTSGGGRAVSVRVRVRPDV
ncbi:hypothetical protein PGTUg99_009492 [Puccinia graminis f. sp. tritici]|uniref:Uncharacterized protein n=1 Tax=Puccinia graminis f. sp. tritici TaxID=56615 RepID=A0A5B0RQ16_PUCGR|nr:hypothetical protein PGTUg99_009492 [Puccinia graminis f. sp. tritici]